MSFLRAYLATTRVSVMGFPVLNISFICLFVAFMFCSWHCFCSSFCSSTSFNLLLLVLIVVLLPSSSSPPPPPPSSSSSFFSSLFFRFCLFVFFFLFLFVLFFFGGGAILFYFVLDVSSCWFCSFIFVPVCQYFLFSFSFWQQTMM